MPDPLKLRSVTDGILDVPLPVTWADANHADSDAHDAAPPTLTLLMTAPDVLALVVLPIRP